jgi:nitrogen-specific signal transduction histidine kinase
LRALDAQRRHLSGLLVAEQNRLAQLCDRQLRAFTRSLIHQIEKQIATIDARIAALIAHNQDLSVKAQKLTWY